jgi:hypothetical protein
MISHNTDKDNWLVEATVRQGWDRLQILETMKRTVIVHQPLIPVYPVENGVASQ